MVYRDIMEGKTEIIQQKERMHGALFACRASKLKIILFLFSAFQNQSNGIDHGYVAISVCFSVFVSSFLILRSLRIEEIRKDSVEFESAK